MTAEVVFFPDGRARYRCSVLVLRDQGMGIKPVPCRMEAEGWRVRRFADGETRERACSVHMGTVED